MNTEEKARAYDEALKWMRIIYPSLSGADKEDAEHFFPQLRESEDERIRKDIVAAVEMRGDLTQARKSEIYAYLEKQKERKPAEPELKIPDWVHGGWDDEYMINTVIGRYSLHAEVAKKRGDTHDYNLSKSMENWLRNVVKPLILEKQKGKMTADEFENSDLFRLKLKTQYHNGYQDGVAQQQEKQKEKPEVDLEDEIDSYFKEWWMDLTDQGYILHTPDEHAGLMSVKQIARHFYKLGLNARKEG